ncbi:MAG: hypothetical protein IJU94_05100 [Clostridia bacterium]|nr:hypothetical protein [Clostridia bacterium]
MMKKFLAFILALALFVPLLAACGKSVEPDSAAAGYIKKPVGEVKGVTLATLNEKLLDYVGERRSGNFVISPMSFKYAYGLMLAGAEGNTKKELLDAFGMNGEAGLEEMLADFGEFAGNFDKAGGFHHGTASSEEAEKMRFALKIANSIWTHEDSDGVKAEYKEKIKNYNAEYFEFSGNVGKKLNEWVSEKTNGLIPKMLQEGYDTDNIAMMLVNALYFRGVWQVAFSEEKTSKAVFTTANGNEVKKDFMISSGMLSYYEDDDTQLVILPIQNYGYDVRNGMVFVLGSTENIDEKISKAESRTVNLAIPKFDVETSLINNEFCDFLKACGVSDAFGVADFSGMTDDDGIFIGSIIQRAKLAIDEKGLEGAAATDIIMLGAMPDEPVNFTADRPFSFFLVADLQTSRHVIFEGRIVE